MRNFVYTVQPMFYDHAYLFTVNLPLSSDLKGVA